MSILDGRDWTGESQRMTLRPDQMEMLAAAFSEWADAHPRRDRPYMAVVDGAQLTPLQMAAALRDPSSPWHHSVVRIFEVGISGFRLGPEEALRQRVDLLRQEAETFRSQQKRHVSRG